MASEKETTPFLHLALILQHYGIFLPYFRSTVLRREYQAQSATSEVLFGHFFFYIFFIHTAY